MSSFGGLGDKLLELIGSAVLCKYKNFNLNVIFNLNTHHFDWGINVYDERLFNFNIDNVTFIKHKPCIYSELITVCSTDISPYNLQLFLQNASLEELSTYYKSIATKIKPSNVIQKDIPNGLSESYGIHLRKTDKVLSAPELCHENTFQEFDIITEKLLKDVYKIIMNEPTPSFLLVSEDLNWKDEIYKKISEISVELNKPINLISISYDESNNMIGYHSVLDMFCLSMCKKILQGVKVSTFSTVAALIGGVPIVNYSHLLDNYDTCFIHVWKSVVTIDNYKNVDLQVVSHLNKHSNLKIIYNFTNVQF
jgi:hypothetical protein